MMKPTGPLLRVVAVTFALLVLGLVVSSGSSSSSRAAGPHIDLLFMSSLEYNNDFCTGSWPEPIHSPYRAIDVIGDNASCAGNGSATTKMRAWGFGGTSSHHTMGAWASGGEVDGGCDEVRIGMIDVAGGWHGELAWLHTSRTILSSTQMKLYAAPSPGAARTYTIGSTTYDRDNCASTAYHVHQGTNLDCMTVNGGLVASTKYPVWHYATFINAIDYEEGLHNCDG